MCEQKIGNNVLSAISKSWQSCEPRAEPLALLVREERLIEAELRVSLSPLKHYF